jgi:uncharacterized protein (DUF58 family)
VRVLAGLALFLSASVAATAWAQEPADLKVELRPVAGSNRFQVGEEIRLQVEFSSSTVEVARLLPLRPDSSFCHRSPDVGSAL